MAQQRFYNATDKLVNAFVIGTIKHEHCSKCAVGTLCDGDSNWFPAFAKYDAHYRCSYPSFQELSREALESNTGYSIYELIEIEKTFEATDIRYNDPDSFRGLCAVFDYMVSIEDWHEEEKGANIFQLLETVNN